ncbi:hypothetical protein [Streptomyces reticuli]|uniref:hypothetical protein n=1 Tax=Streptomyces reticuli TaxID=1926 RepID=UPI00073DED83|nr:hypothetical protein [Streptomyces sp. SID7810]CUW29659.1 hypothetical protein TUE45_04368 [Streptomyces reticuli]
MTAPAIPTPAVLAHRAPAPLRPAAPAARTAPVPQDRPRPAKRPRHSAPGNLRQREIFRQVFLQAVRISGMNPETRLVALTLLGYANFRTGLVNKHEHGPAGLAADTGLTEGQVRVQLTILTQRGWLTERALTTGPREGQRVHQLLIPDAVLAQVRNRHAAETA